ncbi:MAG: UDP-N-acetylmuramate dehydrogenase, partial [Alphaproteobacteria bacterium]|nr:UDP-N-acetylmuramate dehydrogenase [Alphaproteobacteria bacterium]
MSPSEDKKQFVNKKLIHALGELVPSASMQQNVSLCDVSWYKIGGKADLIIEPDNIETAASVMRCLKKHNALYTVIGSASNILFDDAGYRGVLVKIAGNNFNNLNIDKDGFVRVGAGFWVPYYVRNLINNGLDGAIHAIGIPGALGGLIIMNGGSLRKGIGEQLVDVTIIDKNGDIKTLSKDECDFGYRSSALQKMECMVIEATFHYKMDRDIALLRSKALELLISRSKKFPRKYPSCGSVFLSYPKMYGTIGPPGKAIEDLGYKGKTQGGAQISPVHANFIVNTGHASAADIEGLIVYVRDEVERQQQ